MFHVCARCGQYAEEKEIEPRGPSAVCPHCGHHQPFRRLPLFVLTGASGCGKSTLCRLLALTAPECVWLENDILWGPEFDTPDDGWQRFRRVWLRLALNIGQSGRPCVLCGTFTPESLEALPERRYFAATHYLALVCSDEVLAARLRARPAWRDSGTPEFISRMQAFNRWLGEHAARTDPPLTLLDTTDLSPDETGQRVLAWLHHRLQAG